MVSSSLSDRIMPPSRRPRGEFNRRRASRAYQWFIEARRRSVIIIIIIGCSQPAVLRVHDDLAGLAVLRADSLHVSSVADDLDVRPAVGLQLLAHLIFGDRLITSNERGTLA